MPVYDYRCSECHLEWEEYHEVDDRYNEWCACGNKAEKLMKYNTLPITYDYYSENLDAHITGPKQKKKIMEERGVQEAG